MNFKNFKNIFQNTKFEFSKKICGSKNLNIIFLYIKLIQIFLKHIYIPQTFLKVFQNINVF